MLNRLKNQISQYRYNEKVTCSLDVLGYSEKVYASGKIDSPDAYLPLIVLNETMSDYEAKGNSGKNVDVKLFSDSLFVSCELEHISELLWFIATFILQVLVSETSIKHDGKNMVQEIQYNMIRGGITYGKVCISPEQSSFFGPAINDAHKLEANIAIYPRVVLDYKILEKIKEIDDERIKKSVCMDSDIPYFDFIKFLNYEKILVCKDDMKCYASGLKEAALKEKDLRISQKYMWLSSYFSNYVND